MDNNSTVIIGIRFTAVGKIYHFNASSYPDIRIGDRVIVETSRGLQIGQVTVIVNPLPDNIKQIKSIVRIATPKDLLQRQSWQAKEDDVLEYCRERAKHFGIVGGKFAQAEYSFDGSKIAITYSSDSEEKLDLRSLRSDLQKKFAPAQVEMRQVGPRDVAKIYGGMGACGLEERCCSCFLTEFNSISIKMAKEQKISLSPSEITGMCGRLRCCLFYEYDHYLSCRMQLPKKNKRVSTPMGEGKVVDIVPLQMSVIVELPDSGLHQFTRDEITPIN
ncbi:MAG: stage 0 sporulation family protein [Anaerolineae bacterium]|nr:stage 0 sporulation family protein [Anaerolineae bacterium]